jgi:hypothetical protein
VTPPFLDEIDQLADGRVIHRRLGDGSLLWHTIFCLKVSKGETVDEKNTRFLGHGNCRTLKQLDAASEKVCHLRLIET